MVHFKSLKKINDDAYKVNLPNEYGVGVGVGVSVTFNVSNIFLFDVGDNS
jgi:hypothetical protein